MKGVVVKGLDDGALKPCDTLNPNLNLGAGRVLRPRKALDRPRGFSSVTKPVTTQSSLKMRAAGRVYWASDTQEDFRWDIGKESDTGIRRMTHRGRWWIRFRLRFVQVSKSEEFLFFEGHLRRNQVQ